MSRDSGSEHPSQRTVAELLAEYGGGSQRSANRRRRRAEDPSETAPQAIIDRVLSDSGQMRAIQEEVREPGADSASGAQQPPVPQPPAGPPNPPQAGGPAPNAQPPNAQPPSAQAPTAQPPAGNPANAQPPAPQAPPAGPPPAQPPPAQSPAAQSPAAQSPAAPNPAAQNPAPPQAPPPTGQFGPSTGPQRAAPQPGQAPPGSAMPPEAHQAEEEGPAVGESGVSFWARRFAAAGSPPRNAPADAGDGAGPDGPSTVQHPPLGTGSQVPPVQNPSNMAAPPVEGATEQLPRVQAEARSAGDGTAMMAYPGVGEDAPADDPYDYPYEDYDYEGYRQDDYARGDYDDYPAGGADYDAYDADDYDAALPAGMDADDYRADYDADDEEPHQTTGKEWAVLALQGGAGLVAGGVVWVAFRWLWTSIPIAALVAALAITGALVFIARKFLRTDDLQTILLAVLVGLICTVSPAALLLISQ